MIDLTRKRSRDVDNTEEVDEPPAKRVNAENSTVIDLIRKRGIEDMEEADEPPTKRVKADENTVVRRDAAFRCLETGFSPMCKLRRRLRPFYVGSHGLRARLLPRVLAKSSHQRAQ